MRKDEKIEIPVSDRLDSCVQSGLDQLKLEQKREKRRKHRRQITGVAAACVVVSFLCVKQPAWAKNIPLLGHIFSYLEEQSWIQEDYTSHAKPVQPKEVVAQQDECALSQEKNGVCLTLSEVFCTENTMYLTAMFEKEGGFPATDEEVRVGGIFSCSIDGKGESGLASGMQGHIVDGKLIGILSFDVTGLWEGEEMPTSFDTQLYMQLQHLPDEKESDRYPDAWTFEITVTPDTALEKEISVQEQNPAGYGMKCLKQNPYEIYADPIYPENETITVEMCDENGERLERQNIYHGNTDVFLPKENMHTVTVFICSMEEYLQRKDEYERQSQVMTYAEFLSEFCKYQTTIKIE